MPDWKLYQKTGNKLIEIAEHEFLELWNNPNPFQTRDDFIGEWIGWLKIVGGDYIYCPTIDAGPNKGKLVKIEHLPAHWTEPIFGDILNPIKAFMINGIYSNPIPAGKILYTKYWNPTNNLLPMSPLRAHILTATLNSDAKLRLKNTIKSGGLQGWISGTGGESEFSETQANYLRDELSRRYSGPDKAGSIPVIEGSAKWNEVGLSPVELEILKALEFSFNDLCNAYRFPSVLLNQDKNANYNNVNNFRKDLYSNVIIPDLEMIAERITTKWLPNYGKGLILKADYSGIDVLQQDKVSLSTWLGNSYWIPITRKQEIMGEEVDPKMVGKYGIPVGVNVTSDFSEQTILPDTSVVEGALKQWDISDYK